MDTAPVIICFFQCESTPPKIHIDFDIIQFDGTHIDLVLFEYEMSVFNASHTYGVEMHPNQFDVNSTGVHCN